MEKWKNIPGYENLYKVSNYGNIISCAKSWLSGKNKKTIRTSKEKQLVLINRKGYLGVSLCKKSKAKLFIVHRLVALCFIRNNENKPFVNHKNCIKNDNRVENLEWCTHKENIAHAIQNNLMVKVCGEKSPSHKLKEFQVLEILNNNTLLHKELAVIYKVRSSTIQSIKSGKRWKYLQT